MAFTFSKDTEGVAGDMRVTGGTFTNTGGSTGGNIYTGLQKVVGMHLQHGGSATVADMPSVNETLPVVDPVTIVTTASKNGFWFAYGY
jgi:hypothetical protein